MKYYFYDRICRYLNFGFLDIYSNITSDTYIKTLLSFEIFCAVQYEGIKNLLYVFCLDTLPRLVFTTTATPEDFNRNQSFFLEYLRSILFYFFSVVKFTLGAEMLNMFPILQIVYIYYIHINLT